MKRGRPIIKKHDPIKETFNEALGIIAISKKDTRRGRKLKAKKK